MLRWIVLRILTMFQHTAARRRLAIAPRRNMQPTTFQHTAARRRLAGRVRRLTPVECVSTHSRPKAAGWQKFMVGQEIRVSTHSRPKAAGSRVMMRQHSTRVSTHSRPKAAGLAKRLRPREHGGFNTQPPEGGWPDF